MILQEENQQYPSQSLRFAHTHTHTSSRSKNGLAFERPGHILERGLGIRKIPPLPAFGLLPMDRYFIELVRVEETIETGWNDEGKEGLHSDTTRLEDSNVDGG